MRPYLRWLSTQAEQALICGRNKEALALALECLRIDPHDIADARFSVALAYAKLEDEAALDNFVYQLQQRGSMRPDNDPWTLLSRMALRFKALDTEDARDWVTELIRTYPHAAEALIRQTELPVGIFARISTAPYSEDELIVAISEATILLQEGVDPMDRGTLGTWLATEVARQQPQAMLSIMEDQQRQQNGRRA
jgi:tetratricopeptide (TPR) repeat protein